MEACRRLLSFTYLKAICGAGVTDEGHGAEEVLLCPHSVASTPEVGADGAVEPPPAVPHLSITYCCHKRVLALLS